MTAPSLRRRVYIARCCAHTALQGDRAHHSVRAPTGLAGSVLQDSHTFLNARNSSEQAGLAARTEW